MPNETLQDIQVGDKVMAVSSEHTESVGQGFERLGGLITERVVMTVRDVHGDLIETPYYKIHRGDLVRVFRPEPAAAPCRAEIMYLQNNDEEVQFDGERVRIDPTGDDIILEKHEVEAMARRLGLIAG